MIDRSMLYTYLHHHYTPDRMVLAGIGMDHEALVEHAKNFFVNSTPSWQADSSVKVDKFCSVDKSVAQYTGGIQVVSIGTMCVKQNYSDLVSIASIFHYYNPIILRDLTQECRKHL